MGNAPLQSAPTPTPTRVVVSLCTNRPFCGTQLKIHHIEPQQEPEEDGGDLVDSRSALPAPLRPTQISPVDYQEKLEQLKDRLSEWRGGWATLLVLLTAALVVLGFFAAYFIRDFWSSPLFENPLYVFGGATLQILFFVLLLRFARQEGIRLQKDVVDLYRPWREEAGVFVSMKRVLNLGGVYRVTERGIRRLGGGVQGPNCYCIVMDVMDEEQAARALHDSASVVTANTDGSDDEIELEDV